MTRQRAAIIAALLLIVTVASLVMIRNESGTQAAPDPQSEPTPLIQRPDRQPTPTIPPPPSRPEAVIQGGVLFQDTFDTKTSEANWTAVDLVQLQRDEEPARWMVIDGMLRQAWTGDFQALRVDPTIAVAGSSDWSDYVLSVDSYAEGNLDMGVIFRRQGNSFYRFRMVNDAADVAEKIVLEKVIDGQATTLATAAGPGYTPNRWYTLKVTVNGSQIEAQVNDQAPLVAKDDSLAQGQIGVYGYAVGQLGFDNVTVVVP